jgi:hypothetical protein
MSAMGPVQPSPAARHAGCERSRLTGRAAGSVRSGGGAPVRVVRGDAPEHTLHAAHAARGTGPAAER